MATVLSIYIKAQILKHGMIKKKRKAPSRDKANDAKKQIELSKLYRIAPLNSVLINLRLSKTIYHYIASEAGII